MRKPRNQEKPRDCLSWLPGFLIILAVLGVLGVLAVNSHSQPRLSLSDESWDLGQVNQGPTLTREIKVENAGDEPLEVTAVESSCPTCVTGRVEPKRIPPTGEAKLVLKFFSANVEGKQAKHVTLRTNDPAQSERKIAVTGVVVKAPRPKIKVEPETWDVGLVAEGETKATALIVRNEGDALLRITGLTPSRCIGVDAPEPTDDIAPGKAATIKADFLAERGKRGLVKEYVHLESNDPASPTKVVQVTGYVWGVQGDARKKDSGFRVSAQADSGTAAVQIEPIVGEARLPGTGEAFVTGFRVRNRLPEARVKVELEGLDAGKSELGPGESVELRATAPQDASLTVKITMPAVQKRPAP